MSEESWKRNELVRMHLEEPGEYNDERQGLLLAGPRWVQVCFFPIFCYLVVMGALLELLGVEE